MSWFAGNCLVGRPSVGYRPNVRTTAVPWEPQGFVYLLRGG